MADNVIIQNGAGEEVVYENVSGVELLTEDGETATFVHDAEILYENLPDKPFGNKPAIIEEQELAFNHTVVDDDIEFYECKINDIPEPVTGENYIVNWDGTEYTCVCKDRSDDVMSIEGHRIGNDTLFLNAGVGTDTGEPFIFYRSLDGTGGFCTNDTSATHTVSIISVIKIDKKYLPDDIGGGSIPEFDFTAMGLPALPIDGTQVEAECDVTELCAALDKGVVKVKFTANLGVEIEASGVISAVHIETDYQISFIGCMEATPMLLNFAILPLSSKIVGSILTLTAASSSTT